MPSIIHFGAVEPGPFIKLRRINNAHINIYTCQWRLAIPQGAAPEGIRASLRHTQAWQTDLTPGVAIG